jgi:hypothetical protein
MGSYQKQLDKHRRELKTVLRKVLNQGHVDTGSFIKVAMILDDCLQEAYDHNVQLERGDEIHEQIMREAGPWDFD